MICLGSYSLVGGGSKFQTHTGTVIWVLLLLQHRISQEGKNKSRGEVLALILCDTGDHLSCLCAEPILLQNTRISSLCHAATWMASQCLCILRNLYSMPSKQYWLHYYIIEEYYYRGIWNFNESTDRDDLKREDPWKEAFIKEKSRRRKGGREWGRREGITERGETDWLWEWIEIRGVCFAF